MSDAIPVPVEVAKSIALFYRKSQVVILCFDPTCETTTTTTYGVNAVDKENAAAAGEICSKAIGCDLSKKQMFEDFHKDYKPAVYKAAIELFQTLLQRRDGSPWAQQQIEGLLKTADIRSRQG